MFAKGKSRGRIDPVIAATIAVALTIRHEPATRTIASTNPAESSSRRPW
jgi:hypothetical protein